MFSINLGNTLSAGFGSSVTLRFRVSPTTVGCSDIRWTYDGSTVLNSLSSLNGARLSFSSDCYSLTISNVNCNSGGRYQLSATNAAGSDSDYIDLYLVGRYIQVPVHVVAVMFYMLCNFDYYCIAYLNAQHAFKDVIL